MTEAFREQVEKNSTKCNENLLKSLETEIILLNEKCDILKGELYRREVREQKEYEKQLINRLNEQENEKKEGD